MGHARLRRSDTTFAPRRPPNSASCARDIADRMAFIVSGRFQVAGLLIEKCLSTLTHGYVPAVVVVRLNRREFPLLELGVQLADIRRLSTRAHTRNRGQSA
jgi:hypothetical protein